jgi:hypothetical protein
VFSLRAAIAASGLIAAPILLINRRIAHQERDRLGEEEGELAGIS